jgi:hypothetical protein
LVVDDREVIVPELLPGHANAQNGGIECGRPIEIGNGNVNPDGAIVLAVEIAHGRIGEKNGRTTGAWRDYNAQVVQVQCFATALPSRASMVS